MFLANRKDSEETIKIVRELVTATTTLFIWRTPMGVAFESATYLLVCVGVVALYVNMPND